jgi:predicted RNA-binding protein YlqC (UPF0109 family)
VNTTTQSAGSALNTTTPSRGHWRSRVGGLLFAAGLATVAAVGVAAPPAHASAGPNTITFVSVTKTNIRVPSGSIEIDVDKTSHGKVLGADSLNCRVNGPKKAPVCAVSIDLARGDLFAVLKFTESPVTRGTLIGGTGKYANAKGTIVGTGVSQTKADIVVTIRH